MLQDQDRIKMMVTKLTNLSAQGSLRTQWEDDFVWSLKKQIDSGRQLSDNQVAKLEDVFDNN
jgi:hypothetical protein